MTDHQGRSRRSWIILLVLGIILLLDILLAALLLNDWETQLTLLGDEEVTLEYGEDFRDPGATAVFGGDRFLLHFLRPRVSVLGEVNTREVGDYTLRYSAAVLWFTDSRTRTVRVRDTVAPVITLTETPGNLTIPGTPYEEEGYSAVDNADGDLTAQVERREEGGVVYYRVEDRSGNVASVQRQIAYLDPTPPEITLLGGERITLQYGAEYEEPGYVAVDDVDGDITDRVSISGTVDTQVPGSYELRYSVEDNRSNRAEAVRIVTVPSEPVGTVYLTFDDGPSKYTETLLEILDRYNVKVTFFVVNYGYNDVIGKEYAAGHSIGVHSATHDYYSIYASEEAYFDDLQKMNDIIYAQTGAYSELIRFPGGSSNTISDFNPGIMTRLAEAVVERGYQYFDWNVSSEDAAGATEPEEVFQNVIDGIQGRKNSVVLMHDSKSYTVEAVESIVVWCQENGYSLCPLTKDSPASHHKISN